MFSLGMCGCRSQMSKGTEAALKTNLDSIAVMQHAYWVLTLNMSLSLCFCEDADNVMGSLSDTDSVHLFASFWSSAAKETDRYDATVAQQQETIMT